MPSLNNLSAGDMSVLRRIIRDVVSQAGSQVTVDSLAALPVTPEAPNLYVDAAGRLYRCT